MMEIPGPSPAEPEADFGVQQDLDEKSKSIVENVGVLEGDIEKTVLDKVSLEDVVKSTATLDRFLDSSDIPKRFPVSVLEPAINNLLVGSKTLGMPALRDKAVTFAKTCNEKNPTSTVTLLSIYGRCRDLHDGSLEKQLMSNVRAFPMELLLRPDGGRACSLLGRDRIVEIVNDKSIDAIELTILRILDCWVKFHRQSYYWLDDCTTVEERLVVAKKLVDEGRVDLSSIDPSVLVSDEVRTSGFVSDSAIVDALKKQSIDTLLQQPKDGNDDDDDEDAIRSTWSTTRAMKSLKTEGSKREDPFWSLHYINHRDLLEGA
eukprot:CAMPEP_0113500800 /NCGR_PEP_ID=MMETSP0014_2-20120614/32556_1 /TAXON_ID=2857 /ORGANISM="Nitzschia sp." /LENGTH=317 /DNA_ID=CAMNT_0000395229 /DNA_START=51 /DNA_END=1004 /DNA_ORIENTATION=+ /assembly_acc=CAM_ASM_000159